jgi:hypothetical protein
MNGLNSSRAIFLGRPHWWSLSSGPTTMTERAGVVDALAEQVLAEPALLALDHVRQRLQRAVVGALDDPAAATVVEQRVHRLLQHPLLVADDDLRRAKVEQLLEAVVAVDHATVEIVEIRGREPSTVQRHQRPQLWRQHRNDLENHPLRAVAGPPQCLDELQAFGRLLATHDGGLGAHGHAQLGSEIVQVDPLQQGADRFGAHGGHEGLAVLLPRLAEFLLGEHLLFLERGVAGIDDHVGLEVQHPLEFAHGHVEEEADAGRQPLEEPHVGHRRGQLDVAHALAPHLGLGDLDATLVAHHAAVLHALVLAAQALPVGDRAEDLGAEQAVTLGFERAVVDGLRLHDLAMGPGPDLLRARQTQADGVEVVEGLRLLEKGPNLGQGSTLHLPAPYSSSCCSSSTSSASACSSRTNTLNDSGRPGSSGTWPLTMLSYTLARPSTSSDFTVRSSCSVCAAP